MGKAVGPWFGQMVCKGLVNFWPETGIKDSFEEMEQRFIHEYPSEKLRVA